MAVGGAAHAFFAPPWCRRATCSGELADDAACDAIHSVWHVAVALALREIIQRQTVLRWGAMASLLYIIPIVLPDSHMWTQPVVCTVTAFVVALADTTQFVYSPPQNSCKGYQF